MKDLLIRADDDVVGKSKMIAKNDEFTREDLGSASIDYREKYHRLAGENDELRAQIEKLTAALDAEKSVACQHRRLEKWGDDVAEWCIDEATNEHGKLVRYTVDAALCGDKWVPGVRTCGSKKIALVATVYEVKEI